MSRAVFCFLLALFAAGTALAQVDCNRGLEPADRNGQSNMTANDFVHRVGPNEPVFMKAMADFTYTVEVVVQTLQGDQVDGEYRQVSKVTFENGARRLTPVGDTVNTLKRVSPPAGDIDSLREAFTLMPGMLADRDIVQSGRQKIDEFNAILFDILPRNQNIERGFAGRTWVRGRDGAIARLCGRLPDGPFGPLRYLVQRSKVADKYWFPTLILADENRRINDNDVHVRVEVKYSDYVARP